MKQIEVKKQVISVKIDELLEEHSIGFTDWLMTNCELSEDQTIWTYDSEEYSLEGIYEIFKNL